MFYKLGNFNITLEVLEGCGYSCKDCAVDKTSTLATMSEQDSKDLVVLADDLIDYGFNPFEYTIGPTDLASSDNGLAWLDSDLAKKFSERFGSTVISLTLVNDFGLESVAKHINVLAKGKKFRLVLPASLKNLDNKKYVSLLRKNISHLKSLLTETKFYRIYLTINMITESATLFNSGSTRYVKGLSLGVDTTIDFNFAHSRQGLDNLLIHNAFMRDSKHYFDTLTTFTNPTDKVQVVPDPEEGIELTYRDGNLYYTPILLEKFPIFTDEFVIPKPWTAEAVISFKENLYYRNLVDYTDHPTCGDCCFVDRCARGDTHTVMRHIKEQKCMLSVKNRHDLINAGKPIPTNYYPNREVLS